MPRSRFSEEQIVRVLKEQEAGAATAELCRRHGISEQTVYRWKQKYGRLRGSEAKRLKALDEENARRKWLVAEQALDNQMLKDLLRKPGDAGGAPVRRRLPPRAVRGLRASRLRVDRLGPLGPALHQPTTDR